MIFCGNSTIDDLLVKFLERGYYERFMEIDPGNEWHTELTRQQPDVELCCCNCGTFKITLRDLIQCSSGECDNAGRTLRDFFKEHGVDAWCNYPGEIPDQNPWMLTALEIERLDKKDPTNDFQWASPHVMGYADMPEKHPIHSEHTACFVNIDDTTYMFDLTAGQYGYKGGGIMVQSWHPDTGWKRHCAGRGIKLIGKMNLAAL